jgi:hypothetical protein
MQRTLILPVANKSAVTFKGSAWYLDENISFRSLDGAQYSAIFSDAQDFYRDLMTPRTKCVSIDLGQQEVTAKTVLRYDTLINFCLNIFRESQPIVFSYPALFETKKKTKLNTVFNPSTPVSHYTASEMRYRATTGTKPAEINAFYKICATAAEKASHLYTTMKRFNFALCRPEEYDKILDLSVSLETLIAGKTELKFRFCLYNSLSACGDPLDRDETFEMLSDLYDLRSQIIHGSEDTRDFRKKMDSVTKNWKSLLEVAKKSIIYHIFFLAEGSGENWDKHQRGLCLGTSKRLDHD